MEHRQGELIKARLKLIFKLYSYKLNEVKCSKSLVTLSIRLLPLHKLAERYELKKARLVMLAGVTYH